jgi:hypothetical protein
MVATNDAVILALQAMQAAAQNLHPVELQMSDAHLQWRLVGAAAWSNLIAKTELQGPPGPSGNVATGYTHEQLGPSSLWTITHNLNRYPSVTVADSTGQKFIGDVTYVSATVITIGFRAPFSGVAYLN